MDDHSTNEGWNDGEKSKEIQEHDSEINPDMVEIKEEPVIKEKWQEDNGVVAVPASRPRHVDSIDANCDEDSDGLDIDELNSNDIKSEAKDKKKNEKGRAEKKPENKNEAEGVGNESTGTVNGMKRFAKEQRKSKESPSNLKKKLTKSKKNIKATSQSAAKEKKQGKQHKCPSCEYIAPSPSRLIRHIRKHIGEKPFACDCCSKRYTTKKSLRSHSKLHVDQYLFTCAICWRGLKHCDEKVEHEASCKIRRYECYLCHYSIMDKTHLKRHMGTHTGEKPFQCKCCSKKFIQKNNLKQHMKNHSNRHFTPYHFQCLVCARKFIKQNEKDQHEATCQRRRYECYLCKKFMSHLKNNLMKHTRVHHTGDKSFQSEQCRKPFSPKSCF